MNTKFKTTLILCLLAALPTTHASFVRTAKNLLPIASLRHKIMPVISNFTQTLFPTKKCVKQNPSIDFSKIRNFSEIITSVNLETPQVAHYTLSNNKELWFFLDYHHEPQWAKFIITLLNNEDFTHGIIEHATTSPHLESFTHIVNTVNTINNFPFLGNIYLSNTLLFSNNSIIHAFIRLIQQKKVVKPGEYDNFEEFVNACKKEALSYEDIQYREQCKKDCFKSGDSTFSFDYFNNCNDKIGNVRDKKIIQTIIETMQDQKTKKLLVAYGAGHWHTLEKLLEDHFGSPIIFSPENYKLQSQKLIKC